jgi:hypothetical protein
MYLSLEINPPALVQFVSGFYEAQQEIRSFETSAMTPMEMVEDALVKGIAQMKEFNERMDKQYPNSVLAYV